MNARRAAFASLGAMACLAATVTLARAAVAPGPPLATSRALSAAMAGGRSGEAEVSFQLPDPMGGPAVTVRGRVRVESPDRVRLDFTTSGERIALRGDGGEWLQPVARQLLRIPADRARAALIWWRVLLPGSRELFREDSLAPGRFSLAPRDPAAGPVHIVARLGARGYPAELQVVGMGDVPVTYRLTGWKFGPARGAAAYRLAAPAGYETVDLP